MRLSLVVAVCLAGIAGMLAPRAAEATLPGSQTPVFQAAVTDWLAGNEAAALPVLAGLASSGNPSAQLLLAVIDKTPSLQGPWLSALPRTERVPLMRAPGGLSGRSWVHPAAQMVPQAALFQALWQVDTPLEVVLAFARLGESRAARETLVALKARQRRGLAPLAEDPAYPPEALALAWQERLADGDQTTALSQWLDGLHPGDGQRGLIGEGPAPADLAGWLLEAPVAAPVAGYCGAVCPDSRAACALAAYDALGTPLVLWTVGTPVEALVPTQAFVASPKGHEALIRRVLLNADARGRRSQIARATEMDACFGAALHAEAERYRAVRNGTTTP